jgi:hypothetical protein
VIQRTPEEKYKIQNTKNKRQKTKKLIVVWDIDYGEIGG